MALKKKKIAINVATDTPVLFEIGNALIAWQAHPLLAIINFCFAGFVGVVRGLSEIRNQIKTQHIQTGFISRVFYSFVDNLGASLEASGVILILSAIAASIMAMLSDQIDILPAAILGAFGLANLARGVALRFPTYLYLRNGLDILGICFAASGCILTAPDSPLWIKTLFGFAALLEIVKSTTHKLPNGCSDLVFSFALISNAIFSPTTMLNKVANCIFAAAFISLAALKTRGGVAQWVDPALWPKASKQTS